MKKLIFVVAVAASLCIRVAAQSSQEDLKRYVPVLPSVKAQFWKIDPPLGYAVHNVGGGV
jgi:hypothetical protein